MTEVISFSSDRITCKKLEGSANFQQWKNIVKITLTSRNQHMHLTGPKPNDDATWDVVDACILGQMRNSMESNIIDLVTHVNTVKELWEYLSVLYSGQNNLSRIYELSQEFYQAERKERSITQFVADFKRIYEELNALLPISANVQQMQLQREQLAVMGFLRVLGSDYEIVRSRILGGETIASLTDTFAQVLRVSRESSQVTMSVVDNSALVSQSQTDEGNCGGLNGCGDNGGGRGTGTGRGQDQQLYGKSQISMESSGAVRTCHYCGKPGHFQKFCYKLHGRPRQEQRFANAASNTNSSYLPKSFKGHIVVMSNEEFARYTQFQISQPVSSTTTLV